MASDRHAFRRTRPGALPAAGLALAALLAGCAAPLRLGLSVTLTGRYSEPGVSTRNGVLIAVEDLAREGRHVELAVRDDGNTPESALEADAGLYAERVRLIMGHVTSSVTKGAIPQADAKGYLLFSPTANSTDLAAKADNFMMLIPTARAEAAALAEWAAAKGHRRAAAIYDLSNETFTANFVEGFRELFEKAGGTLVARATFTSAPDTDFARQAASLAAAGADCVVIAAGVLDTALIAQRLRAAGFGGTLVSSDWALAPELYKNGGKAAQGMVFAYIYDDSSPSPRLKAFKERYEARFGAAAGDAAKLGWEATMILAEAARRGAAPAKVKKALLTGSFQGLQDEIKFDANGDVIRPLRILELRGDQFLPLR